MKPAANSSVNILPHTHNTHDRLHQWQPCGLRVTMAITHGIWCHAASCDSVCFYVKWNPNKLLLTPQRHRRTVSDVHMCLKNQMTHVKMNHVAHEIKANKLQREQKMVWYHVEAASFWQMLSFLLFVDLYIVNLEKIPTAK